MDSTTAERNPSRSHKAFAWRLLFALLFSAALLWVVGPVMRESDQASVLDGALHMARDGQLAGLGLYNYDRTFVTYWMLAGVFKGLGLEWGDANTIVLAGNMLACAIFLAGFAFAWLRCGPSDWCGWVVVLSTLFCPTLLFSIPLLSSNMISAGWLFFLVAMMQRRGHLAGDLLAGLLAFFAVGARADAVLVMPLLALLSTRESTWHSLFTDRRIWMVGSTSLLALATGMALSAAPPFNPAAIFEPHTFAAYFVFGMGGALLLLIALVAWKSVQLCKNPSLYGGLTVLSLIAPLLYYGWLMYTPRHLVTATIVLMCTAMFERGRRWWAELIKFRCGRALPMGGGALSVLLLFVGVSLDSMKKGGLTTGTTTYYPTSDGHWPMGAYLPFLLRLENATNEPIDHNQRVWGAWKNVDRKTIAAAPVAVSSSGLESYGALFLTLGGGAPAQTSDERARVLVDGRSFFKQRAGYRLAGLDSPIDWQQQAGQAVGKYTGDAIFLLGDSDIHADEEWEIWQAASRISEGDDYLLVPSGNRQATLRNPGPHRWMVILPHGEDEEGEALSSSLARAGIGNTRMDRVQSCLILSFVARGEELAGLFSRLPEAAWVARSSLPAFMQRKKHGGR